MTRKTIEVDLSEKDALRALDEINKGKRIGMQTRETKLDDGQAYEITADSLPVGMFVNLYVDGTWSATTNINLGEE